MDLLQSLDKWFGYSSFRAGQKEIVSSLLEGSDVLAMLPTGTGKSICYQLPAFLSKGLTIVVSPLLSLMQDQVQDLRSRGLKQVAALNSMVSYEEKQYILANLDSYQLLYISPEMLQTDWLMTRLKQVSISYFVVDEAHCISHWGKSFRTDYLKLFEVRKELGLPPCLAITATATQVVRSDIKKHLKLDDPVSFIYSVDRPNISIAVEPVSSIQDKLEKLIEYVTTLEGPGMIYVQSRKWAEKVASYLRQNGQTKCNHYHGGMVHEDRLLIQQQFMNGQLDIVCCTSAFGMGVNKADIRFVIHFHAPLDLESYLQEMGRAGRDGRPSVAILLYWDEDKAFSQAMLQKDHFDSQLLRRVLQSFSAGGTYNKEEEMAIYSALGCSDTAFNMLRYLLEQKHYIKGKTWLAFDPLTVYSSLVPSIRSSQSLIQERLLAMWDWVTSDRCKREHILSYFDENLTNKPDPCCSSCGIKLTRVHSPTQKQTSQHQEINWRQELKNVFTGRQLYGE
ncbi:RecQ family ATP-dependent DNA helicase [Alkalicoccobacillus porphyridii]|uniref:ATP-dependent DNA helicase RecQ n=1 Tax=Alkalicoccobacillus porphyridii TaxID=2597270 RepID=A0A553ZZM0_9BACI|nr:ATP-dependent DNA helicase RecQ [Alkalicoccobacillus porphyridii]TSB46875.1 ATP-dependent DNA helicase RecQ [Alkalicoccobacillus porphyridii]